VTTRRRLAIVVIVIAVLAVIALVWTGRTAQREARSSTGVGAGTSVNGAGARGAQRIDPATVARGSISGTVRSPDKALLAGARVCGFAYSNDLSADATREPVCATSGPDGRYRIDELLPARYEVHAQAARFAPAQFRDRAKPDDMTGVRLAAGQARDGIDITLGADGVEVHGIVRDIGGGPIAGAWVYARRGGRWGNGVGASATAITDGEGEFTLWTAAGPLHVYAEADGYGSSEKDAIAPGQRLELLLTPESVLAGRVIDRQSRAPVAGARVEVGGTWADDSTSASASDLTDADGRFRITRLAPARYKPSATAPGLYGQARESVLLGLGQSVEDLVIEVDAVASVVGVVLLADGKTPCANGWVMLSDETGTRHPSGEVEEGKVEIEAVLPGTYKPNVRCAGHSAAEEYPDVVVTGATSPPEQRWVMRDGGALHGVVRAHDGTPVPDADVVVQPKGPGTNPWFGGESTLAREDGTFEIASLAPGPYEVTASASGQPGNQEDPVPVEIVAGKTADVEVKLGAGGVIAGAVIDEDGAPVGQVNVRAQGTGRWSSWGQEGTQTLDDGTFRLEGVTPGEYRVVASRERFWGGELRAPGKTDDDDAGEKAKVKAGETAHVKLVVESQSGKLRGRVVDGNGAPVIDAFVDAERESDSAAARGGTARRQMRWAWARRPVLTDTDGRFAIEKLSKGTYTVRAFRKGGGEALVEHVALGADVTITIARTGAIRGTVVVTGGKAPETVTVAARDVDTGFEREESFFRSEGAFAIRDLPAGTYELTASSGDGTGKAKATVAEGQEVTGVTITMDARAKITGRIVAADTGAPLPGFIVHVALLGGGEGGFSFNGPPPTSGADGRFELPSVPSGRVQLLAIPMEMKGSVYAFTRKVMTLEGGKTTDIGDVKVPKMRVPQGEPEGDLGFTIKETDFDAEPGTQPLVVAIVKPDGPAAKSGLQVGDVIVAVDGQDCRGDMFTFHTLARVPQGTAVELTLERGAKVTIVAAAPSS
jgi:protocatechuate 3,4-dioxygenase beta subunit